MPLDGKLVHHLERLLGVVDEGGTRGRRLVDDARRLCNRVQKLISMNLAAPPLDSDAMELACFSLQLPMRHTRGGPTIGKLGQVNLRERAEQAAELAIGQLTGQVDDQLLDRATRLLRELPLRAAPSSEAKLLADAVNLDDFGMTGLVLAAMQVARQHGSIVQVADGIEKRKQYGYWHARLKDGFHFEPVRALARQRLDEALKAADLLLAELKEDGAL